MGVCTSKDAVLVTAASSAKNVAITVQAVKLPTRPTELAAQTVTVTQQREFKAYVPPPLDTKHKPYEYSRGEFEKEPFMIVSCTDCTAHFVRAAIAEIGGRARQNELEPVGSCTAEFDVELSVHEIHSGLQTARTHLIVPCIGSSTVYIVAVDGTSMRITKTIEAKELTVRDLSSPYAVHTLPISGAPIHVSCLGDKNGHGKGDFLLLDRKTFAIRERVHRDEFTAFGGDFALQTRLNVLISCEWGHPRTFKNGFLLGDASDSDNGSLSHDGLSLHTASTITVKTLTMPLNVNYGSCLNIWQISPGQIRETLQLDSHDGSFTTVVRFLHNVDCNHAFICSALGSSIFHLHMNSLTGKFSADKVAQLPSIKANEASPEPGIPSMPTDAVISMDDKFLYVAVWLLGVVLQYDISDPFKITLNAKVPLGGILQSPNAARILGTDPVELGIDPLRPILRGVPFRGGPATLQLSLDGQRLYVTNSFYKAWDAQFYPELIHEGGQIALIEISPRDGSMRLARNFLVDLKDLVGAAALPREMRFPDGDSTSDNFL